jgi:iron complex outermembrane receptor protein
MDFYQVEVRNRIAATSTFYGTINGVLYSQVIVDAIIANGNVLDPEVTEEGDTGINLFTNGVTTRTRGVDLTASYGMDLAGANVVWSAAATYTDTEVLKVRATPTEFGTTQPLFDQVALGDLTDTAPKYMVNLGARFDWSRVSLNVHELVYGKSAQWENDGGAGIAFYGSAPDGDPDNNGLTFYRTEVPVAAITNLELSFQAMEKLSFTVGATNLFDKMPPKRNRDLLAAQFGTHDNSAVAQYPSFTAYGINGAYYYGKLVYSF